MRFDQDIETSLTLYQIATGDTREQAIDRIVQIGLHTWSYHPHYMPERLCGKRRRELHPTPEADTLSVKTHRH